MKEIEIIKQDPYLAKIIEKNRYSDDYINENIYTFLNVYESRKRCENCDGLFACCQPAKGERLSLNADGNLIEEKEYCEYGLAIQKRQQLKNRYLYCDISANLLDLELEKVEYTPQQKQLYLSLAAILYGQSERGLYISGDLGVGKTYLCTALANSLVKSGKKVAFVKVSTFFNEMKAYFNTDSSMIDRNISILKRADYLFLDDIGAEAVSEFVRDDVLFAILDYRLENRKITIFTSNLNKEELLVHYQYDRREKANLMNAKRLLERIDILTDDYVLSGRNMRRA